MLHFIAPSQTTLEYLLDSTSTSSINSTLTIWGNNNITKDQLEALNSFVNYIGKHRTYVDTVYDLNVIVCDLNDSSGIGSKKYTILIMSILALLLS